MRGILELDFKAVLLDLSETMLARAAERVTAVNTGSVETIAGDFRDTRLEPESSDVILAAAVLHHLRDDDDWSTAFAKIYTLLRSVGFSRVDLLHKNSCFSAFGAIKNQIGSSS